MNLAHLAASVPFALALTLPLAGCSKSHGHDEATAEHEDDSTDAPQHATKAAKHATTPAAAPRPATPEHATPQPVAHEVAPAAAQPAYPPADAWGRAVDGLPSEIPPPGSKVPTVAEWNAVPKEITVHGSSDHGCETKMLREWLRVSCRTTPGVTPTAVRTTSESGQQAYVGLFGDRTSAVVQVVRGREYAAEFSWSAEGETARSTLHVSWPSNQPRPRLYFDP